MLPFKQKHQEVNVMLDSLQEHCRTIMTLGAWDAAKARFSTITRNIDAMVAEAADRIGRCELANSELRKQVDALLKEVADARATAPPTGPEIKIVESHRIDVLETRVNELLARGFTFHSPVTPIVELGYHCVMIFNPPTPGPKKIERTSMGSLPVAKDDPKPTGWQNRANGIGVYIDGEWQLQYKRCIDVTAYWQQIADPATKLLNSHRYPLVKWGYNATTFGPFIEGEIEAANPNSFGKPSAIDSDMWARFCAWLATILNTDPIPGPLLADARFVGALQPEWGYDTDWIGISDYAGKVKKVIRRTFIEHDLWVKTAKTLAIQLNQVWVARKANVKYVWTASATDIRARQSTTSNVVVLMDRPNWMEDDDWKRLAEEVQFKLTKLENKEL